MSETSPDAVDPFLSDARVEEPTSAKGHPRRTPAEGGGRKNKK